MIWYSIYAGITGIIVGYKEHLGMVKDFQDIKKNFMKLPYNVCSNLFVQMIKFSPATTGNYEYVKECSGRGKCNDELGSCDCDLGFDGTACDIYEPTLSA